MLLITGASRGIGQLLFENFLNAGEVCYGTFHSSSTPTHPNLQKVDVRSYGAVHDWVAGRCLQHPTERLILINCAGITYNAIAHKADIEDWKNVIDVNLIGAFNLIRAVLPNMREQKYGRIINFSSVVAQRGVVGTSAYAASKAGLWGLARALSVENASSGITVNNINLGYFDIGLIDQVPSERLTNLRETIPVGTLGDPANIITTIEFIIQNSDLCGVSIDVNGGLV